MRLWNKTFDAYTTVVTLSLPVTTEVTVPAEFVSVRAVLLRAVPLTINDSTYFVTVVVVLVLLLTSTINVATVTFSTEYAIQ